jgi:hypothetical protein
MRMMLVPSLTNIFLVATVGENLSSLIIKHIDMQEDAEKRAERYAGLIFPCLRSHQQGYWTQLQMKKIYIEGFNNFQKIASHLSQMKLTDSGKGLESFLTELGLDEVIYVCPSANCDIINSFLKAKFRRNQN